MKTAYRYAFLNSSSYSPLVQTVGSNLWKKLWKINIPSKAKVHGWRVCLDILPSLESLESKRVAIENTVCVLCGGLGESTLHLSRDCSFTRSVIQLNPILRDTCYRWGDIYTTSLDWLVQCAKDLNLVHFGELIFILWSVWKERNERVWNQKNTVALDVNVQLVAWLNGDGKCRKNQELFSLERKCPWTMF